MPANRSIVTRSQEVDGAGWFCLGVGDGKRIDLQDNSRHPIHPVHRDETVLRTTIHLDRPGGSQTRLGCPSPNPAPEPLADPSKLAIIVYALNPDWMRWLSVPLAGGVRWLGAALGAAGAGLLFWTHRVLGENSFGGMKLREGHELNTAVLTDRYGTRCIPLSPCWGSPDSF